MKRPNKAPEPTTMAHLERSAKMKCYLTHASTAKTMAVPVEKISGHVAGGFEVEVRARNVVGEHFETIRKNQKEWLLMRLDEMKDECVFYEFSLERAVVDEVGAILSLRVCDDGVVVRLARSLGEPDISETLRTYFWNRDSM